MIENILPFQIYYKNYLSEILNLILTFFSSCDYDNNYVDIELNPNDMIEVDLEFEELLDTCANDYFGEVGVSSCLPICE